jgi:hypothetical protein
VTSAASYYEPPDEWGVPEGCEEDCILDHDPASSSCWTYEDALSDEADREYDRRKDGD